MKRPRVRSIVAAAGTLAASTALLVGTAGPANAIGISVPNNYVRTCSAERHGGGVWCTGYQLVNSPNANGSPDPCVWSVFYTTTTGGGYHQDGKPKKPAKDNC